MLISLFFTILIFGYMCITAGITYDLIKTGYGNILGFTALGIALLFMTVLMVIMVNLTLTAWQI